MSGSTGQPAARRARPSTACVHEGTRFDEATGGVGTPIFTSSAYAYPGPGGANIYPRNFNTVNQNAVARKVAALERGEEGLVFASGTAAIFSVLYSLLSPGDHAVFQSDLYGGTHRLLAMELARYGVALSFGGTPSELAAALGDRTRLLYLESPSNPLLRCIDLKEMAAMAAARGILTLVDNTFASPINQNPLALGIDIVVHSATKYLNGHSDLSAGVIVSRGDLVRKVAEHAVNYGGVLDAHACSQLERGMKTLALRIERHNENAGRLARHLAEHPSVSRVHYSGLPSHPDHAVAAKQMRGFGGMLAFELRDPGSAEDVMSRLRIARKALSLGGVETLVCLPSRTSHLSLAPEERSALGITDGLLRVSVGIEDAEDLLEDFDAALGAASRSG